MEGSVRVAAIDHEDPEARAHAHATEKFLNHVIGQDPLGFAKDVGKAMARAAITGELPRSCANEVAKKYLARALEDLPAG